MAKYVIVGGVAGGAGTAARLRRLDEKAEIVMFERGEYISYANCGLPYYAGNTITERSRLFIMTPEKFRETLQVDVRVRHEVVSINRAAQTVHVKNLETGVEFDHYYDTLVVSPGATPVRPPIPGIDDQAIMTLRSVPDIDRIKKFIDNQNTRRAVVIGAGFIGLEMAENLKERNLEVTVVEALDQVMNILDYDMAALVQQHVREKGVRLHLKDAVAAFERKGSILNVKLASGKIIETDIVILSIGVKPDTAFLREAGISLAQNGAVIVDQWFTTSDPNIRAVGDAIEFANPLSALASCVPLAGPANKQARMCAENIVKGNTKSYTGTIATSIAKVFDLTVASTGLTEKQLTKAALPWAQAITHAGSHAGYYPGALQLTLKILYNPETGSLWGAQAAGFDGVDKRIDVLSAYIKKNGSVHDLAEFEQAYAPPYSSAKDPINMVGFIAQNELDGLTRTISWKEVSDAVNQGACIIDTRTTEEYALGSIDGSVHIPHTELRQRLDEIPRDKQLLVFCAIGLRGYLAERVLRQNGFTDIRNINGGYKTWKAAMHEQKLLSGDGRDDELPTAAILSADEDGSPRRPMNEKIVSIDACGLQCPGPIIKLKQEMDRISDGDHLRLTATDPGFSHDVKSWCSMTGNTLVSLATHNGIIEAVLEKGTKERSARNNQPLKTTGTTLIVFSNDLDRALASFVLANGAAATGKEVTMFFTFWGLTVLRKNRKQKIKKDLMGTLFGMLLPRGMKKLSLSNMHFMGAGSSMMKGRMKKKNIDQLEAMFSQARMAGVRMVACQMSMDLMGITREELVDGIEIGGVATYMEAADKSGVNLFV